MDTPLHVWINPGQIAKFSERNAKKKTSQEFAAVTRVLSYETLAAAIDEQRKFGRPFLVCIDGAGASGKSTLAKKLAAACKEAQVIHMDDFYRPSAERYVGVVSERPNGTDFDLARLRTEVLAPLRSAREAAYRIYDWSADRVTPERTPVTKPIVIVEGVYSSSEAIGSFFDFSIWVECPYDIRKARGLERDGEAARSRWVDDWMPGEDRYIAMERPHDKATLVCDGSREEHAEGVVVLHERR